jgi:glycosyltransferase involved in cell wall biosynthesis
MSNAALEAMEAALPVVMTRCGGIDTYITKDVGWVCEPNDTETLQGALHQALEKDGDALLAMGQRARAVVMQEFQMGSIGRRNLELLQHVVAQNSPKRR